MRNRAARKGFTLVEVIVVLVILALLAAIMIPAMTGWIDKAKQRRVIVACRTCVTAAQTLASEAYGATGNAATVPGDAEVRALAGIGEGSTSGIALNANTAEVDTLTYTDAGGLSVTYYRQPTPRYEFGAAALPGGWTAGTQYASGDTMVSGGYIFKCVRAHTSGTGTNTRDPFTGSNKSTWEVVGTTDGAAKGYDSRLRYAAGTTVTYNGNTYKRTSYNPTSGQTPYANSSSEYWELVG